MPPNSRQERTALRAAAQAPDWARVIASGLPTSYVFEGMRGLLAGGAFPTNKLLAAFALDALYLFAGLAFARAMFGVLRRRGYVTRYME